MKKNAKQQNVATSGKYPRQSPLAIPESGGSPDYALRPNQAAPLQAHMSGNLAALSLSPDSESVVVAGREVLKILSVSKTEIRETLNLRSGSDLNLNYSSNDVKWGNNATRHKIATAAANGAIVLWDLNKIGRKVDRVITEHTRVVNRVCFQPENGNILLSASQDGTMKCWDLRESNRGSWHTFEGKSESVRDVQFNPVVHHEFAAVMDNGNIQKWDMRNPKGMYDRKVSAHSGTVLTVDWHPGGRMVATGGRDKMIKVWDMSADSRRPIYTIKTASVVSRVQWRPGHDYELASCALISDTKIRIWDTRRPNLAKYAFGTHEHCPTGFQWLNADVLYSCGKDQLFIRQEIQESYRPHDLLRRNGMGWNIQGDLSFTIDKSSRHHFVDESVMPSSAVNASKRWKRPTAKTTIDEELTTYIPPQICGIAHLPLFDFEAFSMFAEHYNISSENVVLACEQNSALAWEVGRYRTAQTWKIVALLFASDPESEPDTQDMTESKEMSLESSGGNALNLMETTHSRNLPLNDSDSENTNESTSSDKDSSESLSSSPSSDQAELWPVWQHEHTVTELLDYYTEQGDVQMCVTLYLVLEKFLNVPEHRIEDWFTSYIDLLHRFKLWSTATAVAKACKVSRVREMNENSTTFNIACNHCFKLVIGTVRGSWACDKCHRLLNPCSICHQTVRGLYVWCQSCNHGGHLEHMRDWFKHETQCATGCGHTCVLTPLTTLPQQ
ncbi:WD40-repeat-containing domain protein [Radiomyces spectabilis]|uniref:WD40-repeat-containing domain protein n=1 Tax=Radiomyces spectabilis TaxID=64574 RepID=UPI00221E8A52|nr:WD40-repeat-containing domain protein [Radiomyces spectabilis]KAI8379573.1 WD40-repeat-containing domain protein [Radiomyces spectabilis]